MHELRLGNHRRNSVAHRFGTKKQGFLQATRIQQPVRKHMTAFRIRT